MTATAAPVTARCKCGRSWEVAPRAGGTVPATARCATGRGGCGRVVKLLRAAPGAPGSAASALWAWEPPSEPPRPVLVDESCPDCGSLLWAGGRGTRRVCAACGGSVVPHGVRAPYERGAAVRRVRSQRERDLEALDVAGRKGVMLRQLRTLADDERLASGSAPKVEWFAEQVRAAQSGARLDELAALLPEAGIRRAHWWQGAAPALGAAYDGDEDDDDEGPRPHAQALAVVTGTARGEAPSGPAAPLSAVLARLGWRVNGSVRDPWCQVADGAGDCQRASRETLGGMRLCGEHHRELARCATSA
jgi:hypothetical protein